MLLMKFSFLLRLRFKISSRIDENIEIKEETLVFLFRLKFMWIYLSSKKLAYLTSPYLIFLFSLIFIQALENKIDLSS